MEEDAEPTSHFATGIIAALLAISGSPTQDTSINEQPPAIIYLCSSHHVIGQMAKVNDAPVIWKLSPAWCQPGQPELRSLTPNMRKRTQWVGQGARGYIMHPDFAQFLLNEHVRNYWDLHLADLLQRYRGYAALVFPLPLNNVIHPALPARGSGRPQSYFGKDGATVTDYMLLDSSKGWGLWNMVRTMVWAMRIADFHRLGLFVLWKVAPACDMNFDAIFPSFSEKGKGLLDNQEWSMPFVRISSYKEQAQHVTSLQTSMYCVAQLNCQASVPKALEHFEIAWQNTCVDTVFISRRKM